MFAPWLLRRFRKADHWVSEFPGLSFQIHDAALDAAEQLHDQITLQNSVAVGLWRKTFRSERVHLFVKKRVATESWKLVRSYLILLSRVEAGHPPVRFVVLDNAMNRMLVPYLLARHPDQRLRVNGLGRYLWRWFQDALDIALTTAALFARLLQLVWREGLSLRSNLCRYKVSKELLWGIGEGSPRRHDDFMVDGRLILPGDILFYYRRGSAQRNTDPEMIPTSIANATTKGYRCVNFDRAPVHLATLWKVIVPRYVVFSVGIIFLSLARQIAHPSAGYLNRIIMSFLRQSVGWEVFLASYSPDLNLSQDDPHAAHIADTVALNLHGCKNAGFQWADVTQWRAVTLAYVGYNIYFAWGALPEKYWEGSWLVDRIVHTGYLWGHNYQESMEQREARKSTLTGNGRAPRFVVSLLDENVSPDLYTSKEMLREFYRVGTELLESRPDTVVVAKPKRLEGLAGIPEVQDLIAPYVQSGRFKVWDRMTADVQEVMAISDVVVSMVMGSPYLEAACCQKTGFNFAPIGNHSSRIFHQGFGKIIFGDVESLVQAINWALDHPEDDPWTGLEDLRNDVDPFRDLRGIDRLRSFIHEMSQQSASNGLASPAQPTPMVGAPR